MNVLVIDSGDKLNNIEKRLKRTQLISGLSLIFLGYSVYAQATKIEKLSVKINELESEKGE